MGRLDDIGEKGVQILCFLFAERRADEQRNDTKKRILGNRLFPACVVLVQARLDGTRWQVVPAYVGTGLTVLVDALDAKLKFECRTPFEDEFGHRVRDGI